MPISTAYAPITYAGDGIANAFAVTFPFQLQTDLVVSTVVVATGVTTVLTLGTDYIVTPTLNSPASTGTVTTTVAVPTGTDLVIARSTPVTQLTTWVPNDPNLSTSTMNAVDKLTMEVQEIVQSGGSLPDSALGAGTATTDTFLRGGSPRQWSNTLIGPLGAFTVPADTAALLNVGQSGSAAVRVIGGASAVSAYRFAVDGSSNPWEMQWVYDAGLGKMGWQVFGQSIRGTFDNTGLDVTGTVNATLFTGAADASLITTGVLNVARVGTGSGASNQFLNGVGQFAVPAAGGGINTTTTGTFTIAAVNSTQVVPVTSATGIVVGTELLIGDGTHAVIGHVTVVASLNLTVVTDSIPLGTAGNTMASGASVQGSAFPGNNTIQVGDTANPAATASQLTFVGSAAGRPLGISNVSLYLDSVSGSHMAIAGYANASFTIGSIGAATSSHDHIAYKALGDAAWSFINATTQGDVLHATSATVLGFGKLTASDSVTSGTITPALLNATNSPTDTYALTYDLGSTHFKWVSIPSVGSGTTAQFYRGDNTFTNSLTGPINIDLSSSTTFRIGVANVFGGSTPVQAYMEPVVSGTPTVLPLQIASQVALGGTQYNTIDTTALVENLQVNAIARATAFRSTCGPWLLIYELGVGGGATTIHLANGNYQRFTSFGSNVTITLDDNTPLPTALRFTSELTLEFNAMSTFDVTWPGTITWANGGTAPTVANGAMQAAGVNVIKLVRRQGQTQWVGYIENPPATGSGTVTSVATGAGLTGGPITTTGTISIATQGVTAAMVLNNTLTDLQIAAGANISPLKISGTSSSNAGTQFLSDKGVFATPAGGGGGQVPITMSLGGSTSGMPASGLVSGIGLTASTGMTITKLVSGTAVNYTLSATATAGNLPFYYVAAPTGNATTDTTNISNALATAGAAGGGIVVLQAGVYKQNSTINLNDSGVALIGAGSVSVFHTGALPTTGTCIEWTGATLTGAMFLSTATDGPDGCRFEGFTLFGGSTSTTMKAVGMRFGQINHSSFRDLCFLNFSGIALDFFSTKDLGPNHLTLDNIGIDVGTLIYLAHSGSALSPSTAIGLRLEQDSGGSGGDVFASSFNNICIIHNYIGVWMGNSDSCTFINLHTIPYPNSTGATTPRTPVAALSPTSPNPGVYVTDNSRLNRIVGCSSSIVAENIGSPTAQCSVYDCDWIDTTGPTASLSVGVGCEVMITNGSSFASGTRAGTFYAGPANGYNGSSGLYSVAFNESLGKISLTNRSGTVTSF